MAINLASAKPQWGLGAKGVCLRAGSGLPPPDTDYLLTEDIDPISTEGGDNLVSESGGYTAKAVHFDGATSLHIASLTSTDNEFFSFSFWAKAIWAGYAAIFFTDPDTYNGPFFLEKADFFQATAANPSNSLLVQSAAAPPVEWANYIGCAQTNLSAGNKVYKIFVNDIAAAYSNVADTSPSFINGTNGLPFWIGDDGGQGSALTGDIADLQIYPGVSLLTAGNISQATRRLFIDANGKPVDPATAVAALGTPAVLFSGDATTFGTNQGNGGAFTTTGTLTNASTSPSD